MITWLYQLPWRWNEPWSLFIFGHCRFLWFTTYFTLGWTAVVWGRLAV